MISYKRFFKTLITTDYYVTTESIKQHISNNKENALSNESLNKEVSRKFDRFVKLNLLIKQFDGTQVVYTRSALAKQMCSQYGPDKLLSAYEIIECSKNTEFTQVIQQLAVIFKVDEPTDDSPMIGFYSKNSSSLSIFNQEKLTRIYNFINSFIKVASS